MKTTVEDFCNTMSRCRFLPAEQVRDLRQRWVQEAGNEGARLDRFTAWLVARKVATEYQIDLLGRGKGGQLLVGPYLVLERIGRGRMAGVYRARHTTGAIVAIKILPPSKAAQAAVFARFQREVKLAVSVRHANVVRSFHAGRHGSLYYLAMEYLEGETLEDVLSVRKRLAVAEAVGVVHQALLGLQAIHEQHLVHRDLKPANLMLVGGKPDDAAGAVIKILDLGAGRALFEEGDDAEPFDLTRPGEMLGSADTMSPEQAKDAHNIDIRTDVYALGCILYRTLAGQSPFADVNSVRQLLRHATEEPKPITEHNPGVPGGLQQVLGRMLAKDPAGRYPTPAQAAQALETFLAGDRTPLHSSESSDTVYLEWVDSFDGGEAILASAADDPLPRPPSPEVGVEVADFQAPALPARDRPPPLPPAERKAIPAPPPRQTAYEEPPRRRPQRGEKEQKPATVLGMTTRELLILSIGLLAVMVLGMAALLIWLLSRLFR